MAYGRLYEPAQSKQIVTITREHQLIHDGRMFITGKLWEAVGTTVNHILYRTNGECTHLRTINIDNESGALHTELYENPTISSDGTLLPVQNLNRGSVVTNKTTFYNAPTVTSNGNLVAAFSTFAASRNKSAGIGNDEGLQEIILKTSSDYLLKANVGSSLGDVRINIVFYE